jgi:hypothetical protein
MLCSSCTKRRTCRQLGKRSTHDKEQVVRKSAGKRQREARHRRINARRDEHSDSRGADEHRREQIEARRQPPIHRPRPGKRDYIGIGKLQHVLESNRARAKGAIHGDARNGFAKERVQRGPRERVEAAQVSGRLAID